MRPEPDQLLGTPHPRAAAGALFFGCENRGLESFGPIFGTKSAKTRKCTVDGLKPVTFAFFFVAEFGVAFGLDLIFGSVSGPCWPSRTRRSRPNIVLSPAHTRNLTTKW